MSELATITETAASRATKGGAQAVAPTIPATGNRTVAAAVVVYCLLASLIFYDTLASMVAIWLRSQTFAHGFLILPISLWLAWRMRGRFSGLTVRTEPRALLLVLAAGMIWLVAHLVDVQVIQQLAFVATLISGIWAIVGTAVVRCYAFPLGFLFLAVPMGAGLIPPLMEFTADTTEFMLRSSGIPVFREGMYLSLPTGTWSVIEECSGVRYLIASVTLGLCYAHLTYTSQWRRAAFVVAAIIVPILANSVRAYAVVMVGHLSEMRYGIGADHLVFGWAFFGVVLLLMFWIGGFWQQHEPLSTPDTRTVTSLHGTPVLSLVTVTGMAILCSSLWPAVAVAMGRNTNPVGTVALEVPAAGTWLAVDREDWLWRPGQPGADRQLDQVYTTGTSPESSSVGVHLRQYLEQRQGAELVNNADPWRPDRRTWRVIEQQRIQVDPDSPLKVDEARVVSVSQNLLVWSWYRIDGRNTANSYIAKFLEVKQQILEGRRQGSRIFIATPLVDGNLQARGVLQDFITDHRAAIEASIDRNIADRETADSATPTTGFAE